MSAFVPRLKRFLTAPGIRYLGLFALLAIALFSVLSSAWATTGFVEPFTRALVDVTAAMIGPFDARVIAYGDILRFDDGLGAVQVLSGCNAVEVCALLAAAILAFPGPIGRGLIGVAVGITLLQAVNLLRIITLLYLSRGHASIFEFFHNYVWDAMIGLEGLMIFFLWSQWQGRDATRPQAGT